MDTHLPPTPGNPYAAREDWTRYEGEVRLVDDAFGRIMAKLKALGLGADLFVALTADHGEAFDEHGILGHQDVMYDEVLRVPLLVRYPAAVPARIDAPVELFDLFATIAELAGLPLPAGTHSESLVPLLTGARSHRVKARSFHARYFFENDDHWLAARDDTFKLLARTPDLGPPDDEGAGRVPRWDLDTDGTYLELYDVVHDPTEEHDLFEQNPDIVERLKGELAAWGKMVANPPKRAVPELDDATREALRALGYDD